MEIPEFCTRASRRISRKRKTEEETDPDYVPSTSTAAASVSSDVGGMEAVAGPSGGTSGVGVGFDGVPPPPPKRKPWDERKIVRRSKTLLTERSMPAAELQFIDRPEYSVENWKTKAEESLKKREELGKKRAAKKRMVKDKKKGAKGKKAGKDANDSGDEVDEEDEDFDYTTLGAVANEFDPYRQYLERQTVDASNFKLNNLPNFVMGKGRGEENGPPAFEYRSLWNYELLPLSRDATDEDIEMSMPWKQKDPTVPDFTPEILAMVACFSIGRHLELKEIAHQCRNVEYNPERFAPLIMRIRDPKTTALIFASGRIIVTGGKSEEECRVASRKYARIIQRLGFKVKLLNYEIQNISAHANLRFKVRLNHLCLNSMYGKLSYEPELFPGLIIPLEYPRVKVIIFCTGSVLMTGARSIEDMEQALKTVYPLVKMYAH